jgi:hypothetical protein
MLKLIKLQVSQLDRHSTLDDKPQSRAVSASRDIESGTFVDYKYYVSTIAEMSSRPFK